MMYMIYIMVAYIIYPMNLKNGKLLIIETEMSIRGRQRVTISGSHSSFLDIDE